MEEKNAHGGCTPPHKRSPAKVTHPAWDMLLCFLPPSPPVQLLLTYTHKSALPPLCSLAWPTAQLCVGTSRGRGTGTTGLPSFRKWGVPVQGSRTKERLHIPIQLDPNVMKLHVQKSDYSLIKKKKIIMVMIKLINFQLWFIVIPLLNNSLLTQNTCIVLAFSISLDKSSPFLCQILAFVCSRNEKL